MSTATKPVVWVKSPNTEAWLTLMHGAEFVYHDKFPLGEIDVPASRENFSRLGERLDEDRVAAIRRLACSMSLELPSVVLYRAKTTGKYPFILCDGNHRDEFARRAGLKHYGAYEVVNAGAETISAITRTANGLGGIGQTPDDMIQHAVTYACKEENSHLTTKDVARLFNVDPGSLGRSIAVDELRTRLGADGDLPTPGATGLTDTVLGHALMLRNNDAVMHALIKGVAGYGKKMTGPLTQQIAKKVLSVQPKTQEKMLEALYAELAKIRGELGSSQVTLRAPSDKATRVLADAGRFLRTITTLVPKATDVKDVVKDAGQRAVLLERVQEIKGVAARLEKGLSKK